jgi:hypothetical protein
VADGTHSSGVLLKSTPEACVPLTAFENLTLPRARGFPLRVAPHCVSRGRLRGEICARVESELIVGMSKKEAKKKKKKKTAMVICRDRKEFWTTQKQFWQWVREGVVVKKRDHPLTGEFSREHSELMVLVSNTVLNLAHPNHMREALLSRRMGLGGK